MNGQNATAVSCLVQELWENWGILVLATAAVVGPYVGPLLLRKHNAPKLDIEFKDKDPYCRHAKTKARPYYCHFVVVNSGQSQANDCEAVLEKIWKRRGEKENLELEEREDWIPVNLKWSAEPKDNFERACFKTIYPGKRRYFCDIGSVSEWKEEKELEKMDEKKKKEEEEEKKFKFELPGPFISQDNYLCPGKYKIQISVYSKNAVEYRKKATRETREFEIDWDGGWTDDPEAMPKRLKMKML